MAVGDILKEALLVIETFTVKLNEDIEKGELVCDDGAGGGIVAATAALAVAEKVYMALKAHVYADETVHTIECVVVGYVEVQKVSGSGLAIQGDKLMISATAGAVTKFVAAVVADPLTVAGVQANFNTNAGVVGTAMNTTTDAGVTQKMLLGVIG